MKLVETFLDVLSWFVHSSGLGAVLAPIVLNLSRH